MISTRVNTLGRPDQEKIDRFPCDTSAISPSLFRCNNIDAQLCRGNLKRSIDWRTAGIGLNHRIFERCRMWVTYCAYRHRTLPLPFAYRSRVLTFFHARSKSISARRWALCVASFAILIQIS